MRSRADSRLLGPAATATPRIASRASFKCLDYCRLVHCLGILCRRGAAPGTSLPPRTVGDGLLSATADEGYQG